MQQGVIRIGKQHQNYITLSVGHRRHPCRVDPSRAALILTGERLYSNFQLSEVQVIFWKTRSARLPKNNRIAYERKAL
jgi:hypothetical protein